MSNVIEFKKPEQLGDGFTRECPEHDTLMMLCSHHAVRVFEIEKQQTGDVMVLAHFDFDGWRYLYQGGDGALSGHLFFYLASWQGDATAQEMALDMFNGIGVILRD